MCVTFISAPTVVELPGSASATAFIAPLVAFSINATIAGVAKTSDRPGHRSGRIFGRCRHRVLGRQSFFSSIIPFRYFVKPKIVDILQR